MSGALQKQFLDRSHGLGPLSRLSEQGDGFQFCGMGLGQGVVRVELQDRRDSLQGLVRLTGRLQESFYLF